MGARVSLRGHGLRPNVCTLAPPCSSALRFVLACAAAALASTLAESAGASNVAFEASAEVYGRYFRTTPRLSYEPIENDLRSIPGGKLARSAPMGFFGASAELGLAIDDRWVVPLLGVGGAVPAGHQTRVLTSIDGSMVELRPWTTLYGEALLPGLGVRFKERRWLFSAVLRTAVSFLGVHGSITDLRGASALYFTASSFALRLPVEACRRIDPVERVCVVVTPHLYDLGWASGASVSLRWEWGP